MIHLGKIHYGGSLTKRGKLSGKPAQDMRFAALARLEKLVRLDIAIATSGNYVSDSDIGIMLNRSASMVKRMRSKVEYLRFRTAIMTGVALETEQSAKQMMDYRRAHFKEMLPDALRIIADELTRPAVGLADRKLKVELARDVIDREGSFPKISRTDVHAKVEHNYDSIDSVSNELRSVMDAPLQDSEVLESVRTVLTTNQEFSNSTSLTHDKQEEALHQLEVMRPASDAVN